MSLYQIKVKGLTLSLLITTQVPYANTLDQDETLSNLASTFSK